MGSKTGEKSVNRFMSSSIAGDFTTWSTIVASAEKNACQELPPELRFTDAHLLTIIIYSILMFASAVGNITVLTAICRRRKKARTRINTMLMHLAIADLLVGKEESIFSLRRGAKMNSYIRDTWFTYEECL